MKLPTYKDYARLWIIGPDVWELHFCRKLPEDAPNQFTFGYTSKDLNKIFITYRQSPEELMETFFHEVLHAIEFSWQTKLEISDKEWVEIPHDIIYLMERCLAKFFVDNWKSLNKLIGEMSCQRTTAQVGRQVQPK